MITSEGVSPAFKLSFAITEIPQTGIRGDTISLDESLHIGMFAPRFLELNYAYTL